MQENSQNPIEDLRQQRANLTRRIYSLLTVGLLAILASTYFENSVSSEQAELDNTIRKDHIRSTQTVMPPDEKAELKSLIPRDIWQALYASEIKYPNGVSNATSIHLDNVVHEGHRFAVISIPDHSDNANYIHPQNINNIILYTPTSSHTIEWSTCYPINELVKNMDKIDMAICLVPLENMPPGAQPMAPARYSEESSIQPGHTYVAISHPSINPDTHPTTSKNFYYDQPLFITPMHPTFDPSNPWSYYGLSGKGSSGGEIVDLDTGSVVGYIEGGNYAFIDEADVPPITHTSPFPTFNTIHKAIAKILTKLAAN